MRGMVSSLLAVVSSLAIVAVTPGQSSAANLTTLVSFCTLTNCADGSFPVAGLIADANGNLFSTTFSGGVSVGPIAGGGGTVFEIVKTDRGFANKPTTLASFCSLPNCADGFLPAANLIADAKGNLFGTTSGNGANGRGGTVFEIVKTHRGFANTPTTLVNFCSLPNCADGSGPLAGLIIVAEGNLFGTTFEGGANGAGTVFEIIKTDGGYADKPTTLVRFTGTDGANPGEGAAGVIMDAKGNLFGTTGAGGANNRGTVFEIVKSASGYANTPTTLVNFCSLPNCADGDRPKAGLITDAKGNLFGTTASGGANSAGTAFEITGSGFAVFAGTPGKPNCFGQSVSALAKQYGGLNAAAEALGYPSVRALQQAIMDFCEG